PRLGSAAIFGSRKHSTIPRRNRPRCRIGLSHPVFGVRRGPAHSRPTLARTSGGRKGRRWLRTTTDHFLTTGRTFFDRRAFLRRRIIAERAHALVRDRARVLRRAATARGGSCRHPEAMKKIEAVIK